jgi:hypothetical protein
MATYLKRLVLAATLWLPSVAMPVRSDIPLQPCERSANDPGAQQILAVADLSNRNIDPSSGSTLLAAAINLKYGKRLTTKDVARHLLPLSHGADIVNFQMLWKTVNALGYESSGYNTPFLKVILNAQDVVAITVDENGTLVLVYRQDAKGIYLFYGEGTVCRFERDEFKNRFLRAKYLMIGPALTAREWERFDPGGH